MKIRKRFKTIYISPEDISSMGKTPRKIYDWNNGDKPQWFWHIYVANGRIRVEKWPTNEAYVRQDDHIIQADNRFNPDAEYEYDAVPGELRLFNNRKTHFYREEEVRMLQNTGVDKIYKGVPSVYGWLKINNHGGRNVVSAELFGVHRGAVELCPIARESEKWGKYEQELPDDVEVLVINYKNSSRGTDSISVYYKNLITLLNSENIIKELVKGFNQR